MKIQHKTHFEMLVVVTIFSIATCAAPAIAANPPGDNCGVVKISGGSSPTATDAMVVLQLAVNPLFSTCTLCDVDSNGFTRATDAKLILQKAVNQPISLTCPSFSKTPCTQSGLADKINSLNLASNPQPILPSSHIVFDCEGTSSAPITVNISESWTNPKLTRNFVQIAGTGRFIEFQLDPLCYNRCLGRCSEAVASANPALDEMVGTVMSCTQDRECSGTCEGTGTCSGGTRAGLSCIDSGDCLGGGTCNGVRSDIGTTVTECTSDSTCSSKGLGICSVAVATGCPDVDSGGRRFLDLGGTNQVLRDITVRGFFEGVTTSGNDNQVVNLTLERQCDDSFSNSGRGNVVSGGTISRGCDKCTQDAAGAPISGSCAGSACYHITYDGVSFEGCEKPLRASNPGGVDLVMLIKDIDVSALTGFPCAGSALGADNLEATIEGGVVDGCDFGWALGGKNASYNITSGHYVTNMADRAIQAKGNPAVGDLGGTVKIRGSVIQDNGGGNGHRPRGGVTVSDKGVLDLGTSSDPGNNKICRNTTKNSTINRDIHIDRSNTNIPAQGNYWRASDLPISETRPSNWQHVGCFKPPQRFNRPSAHRWARMPIGGCPLRSNSV